MGNAWFCKIFSTSEREVLSIVEILIKSRTLILYQPEMIRSNRRLGVRLTMGYHGSKHSSTLGYLSIQT